MPANPNVSATELEVLKVLWEHGPGTVRDVLENLGQRKKIWAYTTVLTLLQRLREKGHVRAAKRRRAHVFRAAVSRDELVGRRLQDLAKELCDGASTPIVQALVEEGRFSKKEVKELRRMLAELDRKGRKKGKGR